MPVIKIGKVPFNVYPMAKASTVITSIFNTLEELDGREGGFTLANYLGSDLSESLRTYADAVSDALPKLKKMGIASLGLSTGLVGYYPAIVLNGADLDESSSTPLLRVLKAKCPEFGNNSVIYTTDDGYLVIASTLRKGGLTTDKPGFIGDTDMAEPTVLEPAMVPLLGKAYANFCQEMTVGLFEYLRQQPVPAEGSTEEIVFNFLAAHADEDGGESTVAYANTDTLVVKYMGLEEALEGMDTPVTSKVLLSAVNSFFQHNFKNDDLTFVTADLRGTTLSLTFKKDDPYQFSYSSLGLSDPTKTSRVTAVTRLKATAR